jgi:hypothetical protein
MHYFDAGNCIGRFQLATNEVYVNKTRMKNHIYRVAQLSSAQ